MTSRNTLDTNILKIRDVFALNPATNDIIQPGSLLKIGEKGRVQWFSTIDFFSTMSVPNTSGSVLDILQAVQPGLSSLSSAIAVGLQSTVNGLGSAGYVSTSKLNTLSGTPYNYISASCLFDVINNLGQLNAIQNLGPMMQVDFNNTQVGYVSTQKPGEFKIYTSSLTSGGSNLDSTTFDNASNKSSMVIDITGLKPHWEGNNSSKLIVDVNLNQIIKFNSTTTDTSYITTFLTNESGYPLEASNILEIGPKNSNDNVTVASSKFAIDVFNLGNINNQIQLHHMISTPLNETINLTTYIPRVGGIFVTLDNLDK